MAPKKVWVPPGHWIDYNTGQEYVGCSNCFLNTTLFDLSEVPMLVRAGAIITRRMQLAKNTEATAIQPFNSLTFEIYVSS
jgi:alpha-glucosidase (family GH31 glycosyl hydrolase)